MIRRLFTLASALSLLLLWGMAAELWLGAHDGYFNRRWQYQPPPRLLRIGHFEVVKFKTHLTIVDRSIGWGDRVASASYLALLVGFSILPTLWVVLSWCRERRFSRMLLCRQCGYDLCATPDRCPECGRAPERALA